MKANELGAVPVLMYHQIVPEPESVYGRTPEAFRAELQRLARTGYVPVTAREYVTGQLDIPAGKHPVVLTFDDSTTSQFHLTQSGRPAPNTAIAILLDVARKNSGFRPVATMYVNGQPFADKRGHRELRWLRKHGFEVGNHTIDHANLQDASAVEVQHQIAACQEMVAKAAPDIRVTTLALPFGIQPDKPELALRGSYQETRYNYQGAFLVGAGPAPSPHAADFEPAAIPRIRSQGSSGPGADLGSTAWLDFLAEHPRKRYTSDGDPGHVSFPQELAGDLAETVGNHAQPYQPKPDEAPAG